MGPEIARRDFVLPPGDGFRVRAGLSLLGKN